MNILALDLCSRKINLGLEIVDRGKYIFSEKSENNSDKLFFFISKFLKESDIEIEEIERVAVCTGPGNFNSIRASISAANGIKASLRLELIGLNKFEIFACEDQVNLVSLRGSNNQIYSLILNNKKPISKINLSSIHEINIPKSLKNVSVLGHRAEEIATSLKLENFVEKDDTDIVDLLNASLKVSSPENQMETTNVQRLDDRTSMCGDDTQCVD